MNRFFSIFVARNLEFFRDRATLVWNIFLPIFLIFGFALAFSGNNKVSYKVGTIDKPPESAFMHYRYIKFIPYDSRELAMKKLSHHQIDLVLSSQEKSYYVNSESPNSFLVEKIMFSDPAMKLERKTVKGEKIRYIDWLLPGVIGINILFSCLFGVGIVIVRYRKNGVLKRFKATPMHAIEFVSAQVLSRFFIVALMAVVIYVGTDIFLHFKMFGSYLLLGVLTILAILCHIALGLLFAVRLDNEEVTGGIINLFTWPMMVLSGIFFSLEGTPPIMQKLAYIFPITHFTEAARKIMLDGAGFSQIAGNMAAIGGMTILFLVLAALLFRWE